MLYLERRQIPDKYSAAFFQSCGNDRYHRLVIPYKIVENPETRLEVTYSNINYLLMIKMKG